MRRSGTDAERLIWNALRSRRLGGFKFRRQTWIGAYRADFVCIEARLIVELDGSQHSDAVKYDMQRDASLAEAGYRTLRFWNNDVTGNLDGVLEIILRACAERLPSPSRRDAAGPSLSPRGEGI
ncbi:MAG: endonuclease domain-containing protein [Sphingomonas sp.]|nr:endonuclease domain-containing protein [Sphingomonas sp.]